MRNSSGFHAPGYGRAQGPRSPESDRATTAPGDTLGTAVQTWTLVVARQPAAQNAKLMQYPVRHSGYATSQR